MDRRTVVIIDDIIQKQQWLYQLRQEERELNQLVDDYLGDMPEQVYNTLKKRIEEKIPLSDIEAKENLAKIEIKAFVFEKVLFLHKDNYPNFFQDYIKRFKKNLYSINSINGGKNGKDRNGSNR
jgi:hypothetical protein